MPRLESLYIEDPEAKIDLKRIEHLTSLISLGIEETEPVNLQGISKLCNLGFLLIALTSENSDITFLVGLSNLVILYIQNELWRESKKLEMGSELELYRILNVSPLRQR